MRNVEFFDHRYIASHTLLPLQLGHVNSKVHRLQMSYMALGLICIVSDSSLAGPANSLKISTPL